MVTLERLRVPALLRKMGPVTRMRDKPEVAAASDLVRQVWEAKAALDAAVSYFNNVADPDLVDHAVYVMEAAQRRYSYLLKQARGESSSE